MNRYLVKFMRNVANELGAKGCAVGLSGGVDSSVCAALMCDAFGPENCLGVIIPAEDSKPEDEADAKVVANILKMPYIVHPLNLSDYEFQDRDFEKEVKPYILEMKTLIPSSIELPYIMKLRGRALVVSYYAKKYDYLQCQTLELTEWMLGWFDKFGDGVGDVAPIRHLYKTKVYEIAKEFVKDGVLPERVIERKAGSGNYPLTDEDELGGLTFEEVDKELDNLTKGCFKLNKRNQKILKLVNLSTIKRRLPRMICEEVFF